MILSRSARTFAVVSHCPVSHKEYVEVSFQATAPKTRVVRRAGVLSVKIGIHGTRSHDRREARCQELKDNVDFNLVPELGIYLSGGGGNADGRDREHVCEMLSE